MSRQKNEFKNLDITRAFVYIRFFRFDLGESRAWKDRVLDLRFKTESQAYNLEAWAKLLGPDLLVIIWGGQKPHVGAVAIARPRQSTKDLTPGSEMSLVFCFPGHRDDVIARAAAERLAGELGLNVTVTAGAHWDHIDAEGIQQVIENGRTLAEMIIANISESRSP